MLVNVSSRAYTLFTSILCFIIYQHLEAATIGHHTLDSVYRRLVWSFNILWYGEWPSHDCFGKPLPAGISIDRTAPLRTSLAPSLDSMYTILYVSSKLKSGNRKFGKSEHLVETFISLFQNSENRQKELCDAEPMPDLIGHRRGSLLGGYYMVVWALISDLDHMLKAYDAPNSASSKPCMLCEADSHHTPWWDFRPGARWMQTVYSRQAWIRSGLKRCRVFDIIGAQCSFRPGVYANHVIC